MNDRVNEIFIYWIYPLRLLYINPHCGFTRSPSMLNMFFNQSSPSSGSFSSIQTTSAGLSTGSHDTDFSRSRSHFPMSLQCVCVSTPSEEEIHPRGLQEVVLFVQVQGLSTGNLSLSFFHSFRWEWCSITQESTSVQHAFWLTRDCAALHGKAACPTGALHAALPFGLIFL